MLVAVGLAATMLAGVAESSADYGPHLASATATPDSCALCHRVHTAKAPYLLKANQETVCYTCHGSSAAGARTDVENGVGYLNTERSGAAKPLRGGGFKYALIDSAHPSGQQTGYSDPNGVVPVLANGEPVTSTHSVNSSPQTDWGSGPISETTYYGNTISLRCGSCHDPHGNGDYRLLRPLPREAGVTGTVAIPDAGTKVYTTENYWQVADENQPAFIADISAWCATCHRRYLRTESEAHKPTGDAVFTEQHASNGKTQGSASCIQCHVAHGSNATVSEADATKVHSPEGRSGPFAGPGSMLLRIDDKGTCKMCHE